MGLQPGQGHETLLLSGLGPLSEVLRSSGRILLGMAQPCEGPTCHLHPYPLISRMLCWVPVASPTPKSCLGNLVPVLESSPRTPSSAQVSWGHRTKDAQPRPELHLSTLARPQTRYGGYNGEKTSLPRKPVLPGHLGRIARERWAAASPLLPPDAEPGSQRGQRQGWAAGGSHPATHTPSRHPIAARRGDNRVPCKR